MERGELLPVRPEDGVRLTKELAPCLYCEGGQDDGSGLDTRNCEYIDFGCVDWQPGKRAQRVAEAIFPYTELLEYEERSGVGPGRPIQDDDQWLYDEDALGPGERFESLVESKALQKWFTGAELLVRWDMVIGELALLIRNEEICPINEFTLERRTKDVDPCLYCEGGIPAKPLPEHRWCNILLAPPMLCNQWKRKDYSNRLLTSKFHGEEILAYEESKRAKGRIDNGPKRRIINDKDELLAVSKAAEEQMTEEDKQQAELKHEAFLRSFKDTGIFNVPGAQTRADLEAKFSTMMKGIAPISRGAEAAKSEAPAHVQRQQIEDHEPTNAADYVVWRRKRVRSIHDGQLMLEVQDRWGKPPKKEMDRVEIAALVKGEDPPGPKDTDRRRSLESAFKYTTKTYKNMLKK